MSFRESSSRRAYTLFELLLVLGLIVVLAGFATPALRQRLARSRLEGAAQDVRTELAKARLGAISSGETWEVRVLEGEGKLRVLRGHSEESTGVYAEESSVNRLKVESPRTACAVQVVDLPLGVCVGLAPAWVGNYASPEPGQAMPASTNNSRSNASDSDFGAEQQWSQPIHFFPDGTTDDAEIVLENQQEQTVAVALEGLTGTARVGPMQVAVEGTESVPRSAPLGSRGNVGR